MLGKVWPSQLPCPRILDGLTRLPLAKHKAAQHSSVHNNFSLSLTQTPRPHLLHVGTGHSPGKPRPLFLFSCFLAGWKAAGRLPPCVHIPVAVFLIRAAKTGCSSCLVHRVTELWELIQLYPSQGLRKPGLSLGSGECPRF